MNNILVLFAALYSECAVVLSTPCSSVLTSKQYSCPRMLEWTGLMMASSSRVRSSASAALLGDSKDSWEWDSLKLCIKRVLGGVTVVVRCEKGRLFLLKVALRFSCVYKKLQEMYVCQGMKIMPEYKTTDSFHIYFCVLTNSPISAAK